MHLIGYVDVRLYQLSLLCYELMQILLHVDFHIPLIHDFSIVHISWIDQYDFYFIDSVLSVMSYKLFSKACIIQYLPSDELRL